MPDRMLTDAEVLAELTEDERAAWHALKLDDESEFYMSGLLRRLALARREAREAVAREREACAALCDGIARELGAPGAPYSIAKAAAAIIRARGGGNG